jgi:hypothetical protein
MAKAKLSPVASLVEQNSDWWLCPECGSHMTSSPGFRNHGQPRLHCQRYPLCKGRLVVGDPVVRKTLVDRIEALICFNHGPFVTCFLPTDQSALRTRDTTFLMAYIRSHSFEL